MCNCNELKDITQELFTKGNFPARENHDTTCLNSEKTNAVIVIRIAQSQLTPHSISRSTKVYIRTGNRNKPEELITVGQLQWLVNQRNKSQELRKQLFNDADNHFHRLCLSGDVKVPTPYSTTGDKIQIIGCFTMALSPAYPIEPFCTPPDLNEIYSKIKVNDYFSHALSGFPITEHQGTIVKAGLIHSLIGARVVRLSGKSYLENVVY